MEGHVRNPGLNRVRKKHWKLRREDIKEKEKNNKIDKPKVKKLINNLEDNYYDVIIGIPTFNRIEKLKKLINSIYIQKSDFKYCIFIIDDGSDYKDEDFYIFNKFSDMSIIRNIKNNGKKFYWETINNLFQEIRLYSFKYFIQIDDDFTICSNFINTTFNLFESNKKIKDSKLGAISLHLNKKNDLYGNRWELGTSWVDGGSIYNKDFLEDLDFKIEHIPLSRWKSNDKLSSGVWSFVSKKLKELKYLVAKPNFSILYHDDDGISEMNNSLRKDLKINTYNFIGDKVGCGEIFKIKLIT